MSQQSDQGVTPPGSGSCPSGGAAGASPPFGEYPSRWPDEITPELASILGRQCFTFIKLSQAYRAAGVEIETQAEAEQAYFLHKMLTAWFKHGEGWADSLRDELRDVYARAAIATEARRAETSSGSVREGAGPQDIAQTPPGSDQ